MSRHTDTVSLAIGHAESENRTRGLKTCHPIDIEIRKVRSAKAITQPLGLHSATLEGEIRKSDHTTLRTP